MVQLIKWLGQGSLSAFENTPIRNEHHISEFYPSNLIPRMRPVLIVYGATTIKTKAVFTLF